MPLCAVHQYNCFFLFFFVYISSHIWSLLQYNLQFLQKKHVFCIYKTITKRNSEKRMVFFCCFLVVELKNLCNKGKLSTLAHPGKKALLFSLIGNGLIRDWNGLYQRLHTHERASRLYRAESFAY